jgi:hypothetical protein
VERLRFPVRDEWRGGCYLDCQMRVSDEWVYIFGDVSLSVWNLDTVQHVTVPHQWGWRPNAAISPDGRYLVTYHSFLVQIWDTTALAGDLDDRQPIIEIPFGSVSANSIRFVDAQTFEVSGYAGGDPVTLLYDAATGQPR